MENKLKAKDLRIGNWYKWLHEEHESYHRVDLDFLKTQHEYDTDPQDDRFSRGWWSAPVPITKELLLKNRFSLDDSMSNLSTAKWYMIPLSKDNWLAANIENKLFSIGEGVDWSFPMDLEFVHRLQNIYQSLTGKELEFTL